MTARIVTASGAHLSRKSSRNSPGAVLRITASLPWFTNLRLRIARRPFRCDMPIIRDGSMRRRWDRGRLPWDHTPDIDEGKHYVEYRSAERYCVGCSRAAGLVEWN